MELGELMRQRRMEQGVSLNWMARKCRCHMSHLSRIERGVRKIEGDSTAVPLGIAVTYAEQLHAPSIRMKAATVYGLDVVWSDWMEDMSTDPLHVILRVTKEIEEAAAASHELMIEMDDIECADDLDDREQLLLERACRELADVINVAEQFLAVAEEQLGLDLSTIDQVRRGAEAA